MFSGLTSRWRMPRATGEKAPILEPLGDGSIVHLALLEPEQPAPPLPPIARRPLEGRALIRCYLDGALLGSAVLHDADRELAPAPRAFGHVFCRWLRDGGVEAGFDLTAFLSRVEGEKYERLLARPLAVGEIVTYTVQTAKGPLPRGQ